MSKLQKEADIIQALESMRQHQPAPALLQQSLQKMAVTKPQAVRLLTRRETFMNKLKVFIPLVAAVAAIAVFVAVRNPLQSVDNSNSAVNASAVKAAITKAPTGKVDDAAASISADATQESLNTDGEPDVSNYDTTNSAASNVGDSYNENNF